MEKTFTHVPTEWVRVNGGTITSWKHGGKCDDLFWATPLGDISSGMKTKMKTLHWSDNLGFTQNSMVKSIVPAWWHNFWFYAENDAKDIVVTPQFFSFPSISPSLNPIYSLSSILSSFLKLRTSTFNCIWKLIDRHCTSFKVIRYLSLKDKYAIAYTSFAAVFWTKWNFWTMFESSSRYNSLQLSKHGEELA